jgi:hypothetical protein
LNPPLLLRLGWIPTALALAGVICLKWARNRERRAHIIFMLVAIVGLIFMAAPLSSAIWEHLPLIEFVQFPWRFVGRAALPLAFLAGVPFAYLPAGLQLSRTTVPLAPILTAAAAALLVLEALPHLYPHICAQEPFPTISTLHAYEHNTGMVGVDPTGSYFPNTVKVRPDGSLLESDYEAGETPRRFDVSVFPPGASLLESDYDLLSGRAIVDSPTPFKARYLTFYYPGWRVKVDGEPVPIIISDPDGLITIPVPAGEHTIEVFWSTTPVRGLFTAFSILAAIAVISLSFLIYRSRSNSVNNVVLKGVSDTADELPGGKLDWLTIGLLIAIGVGLILFKSLLVDTERTPFYRQADAPVENRSRLVAGELLLDGFNIKADELSSGESFEIDLAWRVLEPPQADYQSNIWLRSSDGLTWSDKETYRPRIFEETAPSQFWLPGQWVWDSREIEALKGTPPGWYEIVLILFDKESLQPLTLIGVDGQTLGPEAVIGEIEVTEAESTAEIEPEMDINQEIDGLFLRGFNQDRFEVNPGESLLLTFFWEKLPDSEPSGEPMYLALKDSSEDIVQQWSIYPIREEYPSSEWPQDQLLRGQHVIQLGPDLESGVFSFYINGVKLGEVKVGDLERLFDQPDVGISISANFDEKAMLTGLTMLPDGIDESRQMEIALVWQGLEQMPVSYRVFIHLVNEQGDIVAQSDGIPAGWTRPTTGWLPGEYIVDKHVLDTRDIEVDQPMKLRIGLYDPATGTRVTIANQEFVTLNLPAAGG